MSTGTGRIYKRGETWWIDYSFRGTRYRESSRSTKKKDAQALLRKRTAEMSKGGPMVDEEAVTLADLRAAIVADYEAEGNKSVRRGWPFRYGCPSTSHRTTTYGLRQHRTL